MPRRYSTPPRPLPPEAHKIIQQELSAYNLDDFAEGDSTSAFYRLDALGPFEYVGYSTVGPYGRPLPNNRLSWDMEGEQLVGKPPEELIRIGNEIVEVRGEMAKFGYSFESLKDDSEYYEVRMEKPVDLDRLAEELRRVRAQFDNWNQ